MEAKAHRSPHVLEGLRCPVLPLCSLLRLLRLASSHLQSQTWRLSLVAKTWLPGGVAMPQAHHCTGTCAWATPPSCFLQESPLHRVLLQFADKLDHNRLTIHQ